MGGGGEGGAWVSFCWVCAADLSAHLPLYTVKPVLSGPVLNGHLSKSRKSLSYVL